MKKLNIPVWFFVHDFIPYYYPQYCTKSVVKAFKKWIKTVINYSGLICNSKTTMNETFEFLKNLKKSEYNKNIKIDYIHIGTDFIQKKEHLKNKENLQFLAVSTVEPRKKYDQIVGAFEILWNKGADFKLNIVGRAGWNNEKTINLIRNSKFYNKNLFWHEKYISDQKLEELYESSCALIFASETEGFGSPLIEAIANNVPLIVRDLDVFREVTENNAFFFKGFNAEDLANAIENWIELYKNDKEPLADIKLYNWKESTDEVCKIMKLK